MACQLFETGRLLCLFDKPADGRDFRGMLFNRRGLVRFTTLARPKARCLGIGVCGMEAHILRSCQARGAGRTAVHARSLDRVVECAIGPRVAGHNGGPTGIAFCGACPLPVFVLICSYALLSMIHVTHTNVPAMFTPDAPVLAFKFVASILGSCPYHGYTLFSHSN